MVKIMSYDKVTTIGRFWTNDPIYCRTVGIGWGVFNIILQKVEDSTSYIILSNARGTASWCKKLAKDFTMLYEGFKQMLLPYQNYATPICLAI
jgi:hypothetical protein